MHGLVAARLGATDLALNYFKGAAAIDLADTHAAIGGGIHIGTQGGVWMATVFGFAGLALKNDALAIAPQLTASWDSLQFRVQWRGRRLKFKITQAGNLLDIALEDGAPTVEVRSGHGTT